MRRKDREVTDPAVIEAVIQQCTCCRLGFYDKGEVYIVPLNFGYEAQDGGYVLYFHGAKEGRKAELIRKNPTVGFEMDTNYALNEGEAACGYSARFQSVMGSGELCEVTEQEEKTRGLLLLMKHYTGRQTWDFDAKPLEKTMVFKLQVTKMSCKEHK